jgi:hypothetical protein
MQQLMTSQCRQLHSKRLSIMQLLPAQRFILSRDLTLLFW